MIPTLAPRHPITSIVPANSNGFFKYDFTSSPLKSDHENRPIWICPNLHLYLETYSPIYKQAYDFLIAISDPVSRPLFIHEYVISQYSLYAAASLGLSTEDIVFGLQRLCKNQVPHEVKSFIAKHTEKCGKVKLLLKNQRYYIESPYHHVLTELIYGSTDIRYARCDFNTKTPEGEAAYRAAEERQIAENAIAAAANAFGTNAAQSKRTALHSSSMIYYDYDEQTGYIVEEINADEEEFFLQGTGTIDKDGNRTLAKIDQRAAMGIGHLGSMETLGDDFMHDMAFLEELGMDVKNELGMTDSDDGSDNDSKVKSTNPNDDFIGHSSDEGDLDDIDTDEEFISSDSDNDSNTPSMYKNKKKIKKKPIRKTPLTKRAQAIIDAEKAEKKRAKIDRARKRKETAMGMMAKGGLLMNTKLYSFEIYPDAVENVRTASNKLGYPMLEEYDFRHDHTIDHCILPMSLRPQAQIREYQEKALSKMFGNGRARSGIIVLPCGAGKTLVGITAMATVNRSCLIVVSTGVAAQQWKEQVKLWTTLPEDHIYVFTSRNKVEINRDAKVVIATYSMLAYEQERSGDAQKIMDVITNSEWGLLLLDEVHVAPADKFKKCITMTHSRCKLGLTATLVREDDKVVSLIEMIGPKLYEASWLDLSRQGFIATVRCYEVWCPMTAEFYREYLNAPHHLQRLLYVTNPNKFQTLEALMRLHESRGDKIMIFCEDTTAIRLFSHTLNRPALLGETKDVDRLRILKDFSTSPRGDSVIISKIGDNSIDLPDTNVIIQISSHYASRRQEAQRLGRILRPKSHRSGAVDAHFYSLVSQDTNEMLYATKRQRFLVDQGYAYKILKQENVLEQTKALYLNKPLGFSTKAKQEELLDIILESHYADKGSRNAAHNSTTYLPAEPQSKRKAKSDEAFDSSDSDDGGRRKTQKKQRR